LLSRRGEEELRLVGGGRGGSIPLSSREEKKNKEDSISKKKRKKRKGRTPCGRGENDEKLLLSSKWKKQIFLLHPLGIRR